MGWIKLDRKLLDNGLWQDKPFTKGQAWVDLLLLADYEEKTGFYRGNIKHYKSGVVYRSIKLLAMRWGWSRDKTRRYLKHLEDEEMVIVNATTNDTTITIVNWELFQGRKTTNKTTDKTTHKATDNTTDNTHTRNKEYKENKEIYSSSEPEDDFFESWIINDDGKREFIDMKQVETEEGFVYFDRAGNKYLNDYDKGYILANE